MSNHEWTALGQIVSVYARVDVTIRCACPAPRLHRVTLSTSRGKAEETVTCPLCGHSYTVRWDQAAQLVMTEEGGAHDMAREGVGR